MTQNKLFIKANFGLPNRKKKNVPKALTKQLHQKEG